MSPTYGLGNIDQEVRKIDKNHIIMMECFTFPNHGVSPNKYHWDNIVYSYHI